MKQLKYFVYFLDNLGAKLTESYFRQKNRAISARFEDASEVRQAAS
jgi:hypothetical protein